MTNKTSPLAPLPKRYYLIDQCLPLGRVHLLAGPSGAGKSTLLFQMAAKWAAGEDFLGMHTQGHDHGRFYYVKGDGTQDEAQEHMEHLGVANTFDYRVIESRDAAPQEFYQCPDDTRILAIDAGERLVENINLNSPKGVMDMLLQAQEFAQQRQMAIILIVGSPKMKRGEEYLYGRERVSGSSLWGRFASTVFNIVMGDPAKVDDPNRTLYIYPRLGKAVKHGLLMTDQGLVTPSRPVDTLARTILLANMPVGQEFTRMELSIMAGNAGVDEATLDSGLASLMAQGMILVGANGRYSQRSLLVGTPYGG